MGFYDGVETHKDHLFDIEAVIVQAMPGDLRTQYLNSVYSPAGVSIAQMCESSTGSIDLVSVIELMIKEDSEAQIAILRLSKNAHLSTLEQAEKELIESIALKVAALETIRDEIEQIIKVA